jgi:hypothetical protein
MVFIFVQGRIEYWWAWPPSDVREPLGVSPGVRVDHGSDGVLHVLVGPATLHLDRACCEELTTTLARAMMRLSDRKPERPVLRFVAERDALLPEAGG